MGASVRNKVQTDPVDAENMLNKKVSSFMSSLVKWMKWGSLGKAIYNCEKGGVTFREFRPVTKFRKICDQG